MAGEKNGKQMSCGTSEYQEILAATIKNWKGKQYQETKDV